MIAGLTNVIEHGEKMFVFARDAWETILSVIV